MAEIAFTVERDCACRFLPAPEFSGEEPVWTKVCGYHAAQRDKLAASQRRVEELQHTLTETDKVFTKRQQELELRAEELEKAHEALDDKAGMKVAIGNLRAIAWHAIEMPGKITPKGIADQLNKVAERLENYYAALSPKADK